jgi:ABC-type transporter Mla subunit MlaD
MRATLARINATLKIADPLIAQLRKAAPDVVPAVSRLRPVVTEANGLLTDASPLVSSLRPAARSLAVAAREARPVVEALKPILARTEDTILADLAKSDPVTGRATFQMIGPTVASLNAVSAGYDKVSHFVALTPGGGERAMDPLPCKTYFVQPGSKQLVACQTLDEFLQGLPRLAQRPTSRDKP